MINYCYAYSLSLFSTYLFIVNHFRSYFVRMSILYNLRHVINSAISIGVLYEYATDLSTTEIHNISVHHLDLYAKTSSPSLHHAYSLRVTTRVYQKLFLLVESKNSKIYSRIQVCLGAVKVKTSVIFYFLTCLQFQLTVV